MKRYFQTRAGRLLIGVNLVCFVSSLVIGPGPAEAMADTIQDGIKSMQGTHRALSTAEMKNIEGAATAGAPDPWEAGDSNAGGYGTYKFGDMNELISIPIVGYKGRGLSVGFALNWNSGAPASSYPYNMLPSYPCGSDFTNSYNIFVKEDGTTGNVTLTEGDGRQRLYTYSSGSYVPPVGIHDTLVKNMDSSFTLTRKNQVKLHFSTSTSDSRGLHLDTITDSNSNAISISYSSFTVSGSTIYQATSVTDSTGRVLSLGYTSSRLSSITDPLSPLPGSGT